MSFKSPTIDEIKKYYQYKIDPFNMKDTPFIIYCMFYGHFVVRYEDYAFEERINEIKKILNDKSDQIDKTILESYDNTLNQILEDSKEIREKVKSEYWHYFQLLGTISNNYQENINKPGAQNVYVKINEDIIGKEANKFMHYEKLFILYNDEINNIKKNLSN